MNRRDVVVVQAVIVLERRSPSGPSQEEEAVRLAVLEELEHVVLRVQDDGRTQATAYGLKVASVEVVTPQRARSVRGHLKGVSG